MKVYLNNRPYDNKSIEAEYFIAAVQRERFDYTKWHQEYFAQDEMVESFLAKASVYANSKGK